MDPILVKAVQARAPAFPPMSDTYDIWPTSFMSKQDRKRRLAREHNDAYVAAQRGVPFQTDDVGPRGVSSQEHVDPFGEALGQLYVEYAQQKK